MFFLCWKHLKTYGQTGKHCFRNKNVSEFLGKHFCFPGSKFCFRNNVSRGPGAQGNIDRKHALNCLYFPVFPYFPGDDYNSLHVLQVVTSSCIINFGYNSMTRNH